VAVVSGVEDTGYVWMLHHGYRRLALGLESGDDAGFHAVLMSFMPPPGLARLVVCWASTRAHAPFAYGLDSF